MRSPQRPGLFFRTSHPRAALRLWARPGQEALNLLICASTTMIGGPARLEVLFEDVAGERSLGELEVPWEEWAVHSLPCRISSEGPVTITLKTHTVAVPHAVLNNGDHREFGVHLAAAHLR
jgi:hypothetical protein